MYVCECLGYHESYVVLGPFCRCLAIGIQMLNMMIVVHELNTNIMTTIPLSTPVHVVDKIFSFESFLGFPTHTSMCMNMYVLNASVMDDIVGNLLKFI